MREGPAVQWNEHDNLLSNTVTNRRRNPRGVNRSRPYCLQKHLFTHPHITSIAIICEDPAYRVPCLRLDIPPE
jgi:hypothetical protein